MTILVFNSIIKLILAVKYLFLIMAPCTTRNSQLADIEVDIATTSQNIQQEPQEQESLTPTLCEPITPTNTRDVDDNDPPSNC